LARCRCLQVAWHHQFSVTAEGVSVRCRLI
jgi:hypothetical protein